jgi:hypothetical protein
MDEMEGKPLANYAGIADGRLVGLLMAPWGGKTKRTKNREAKPSPKINKYVVP